VADSKIIKLFVDDEPFWLADANLLRYDRRVNMRSGTLDREILWETLSGKQVLITSRRLISFEERHVAAIYLLSFLIYTSPWIARNLLSLMLAQARARAKQLGHRGAIFPWRTISGEEASAYYAAGTAQYHINADIMYALRKYVQATGDGLFLRDYGAEMLVETARLWADLGFYSDAKGGKFCINGGRQQQRLHQLDGPRKPALRNPDRQILEDNRTGRV
jgi:trehalose/maltose hydrolase-like predicted phosphorylase